MELLSKLFLLSRSFLNRKDLAGVAKLADALDLGSSASRHVGSSPSARTNWFEVYGMNHKLQTFNNKLK
jgi:hypothetical protein